MRKALLNMKILLVLFFLIYKIPAIGQYNNPTSEYYRNGYLWNPALAGTEYIRLYALFNNSWNGFDGSARLIEFSLDAPFTQKMGAGIKLSSFSSGLFNEYTGAITYAYSLDLSKGNKLRLGGNISFYKAYLDAKELSNSGQVDPVVAEFNDKNIQLNGDLGVVLQLKAFIFGVSGYNLSNYFQNANAQQSDWQIGQLQASYLFPINENKFSLQPLIAYQLFHSSDNIFLGSIEFTYQKIFHASLCWQSTGSIIGGLGIILNENLEINLFYISKNKYGFQEQYETGIKYTFNR